MKAKLSMIFITITTGLVVGCSAVGTYKIVGTIPVYPEPNGGQLCRVAMVLETQPEFLWEGVDGKSYDIYVREAIMNEKCNCYPGTLVYQAEGITMGAYKLPIELNKGMLYNWSIKESNSNLWSHFKGDMAVSTPLVDMTSKEWSGGYYFYIPKDGETTL